MTMTFTPKGQQELKDAVRAEHFNMKGQAHGWVATWTNPKPWVTGWVKHFADRWCRTSGTSSTKSKDGKTVTFRFEFFLKNRQGPYWVRQRIGDDVKLEKKSHRSRKQRARAKMPKTKHQQRIEDFAVANSLAYEEHLKKQAASKKRKWLHEQGRLTVAETKAKRSKLA